MALYCGIDLHSNNHVLVIIDEKDKRLVEKTLPNDLSCSLRELQPYKRRLKGIAVESTFNWYSLVDGLMAAGYPLRLVNTCAVKQYEGLKYSDDKHDAFWLAHLMRLAILPTGYIYPKEKRSLRDLLRRRMKLVRLRSTQILSLQNQLWRSQGGKVSSHTIQTKRFAPRVDEPFLQQALNSDLVCLRTLQQQIRQIEQTVEAEVQDDPRFALLRTVPGIGLILALTILLETGDIRRFASVGDYASYCRCVRSERLSNGKKKGEGNQKCGNKYLSWAFSEAAHFILRFEPRAKRFYDRKYKKTNGIIAIRALAHKVARAVYFILRDEIPFKAEKLFV